MVTQRTGNRASRTLLAQLYRATGGNPFYALELARSDIWRTPLIPGQPIIVPEPLRALVSDRLSALPAATRETLLIASALSEPTVESVRQAGGGDLSKAVANGVIELDGERIRFTHSLFASVLYAQAPAKRRREVHELLVTVAPSAEYVRISVADTGGWSGGASSAWTTRMGSSQRLERPSLAALRHAAEAGGGALVCARHACCGGRADLYLPIASRRPRSIPVLS